MGSKTNLKVLSRTSGMILARRGHEVSRQGFVLTSISQVLKSWSSMKSYPKSSKQERRREGSMTFRVARTLLMIKLFIRGTKSSSTE